MSNRLKNGSFCVLPFIEEYQYLNGSKYFCCHSNTKIDSVDSLQSDKLRQKIWNGEKIPHCSQCYQQEINKTISPRLLESSRWLKDTQVKNFVDSWTPGTPPEIFYYDIRFDNKCNLACISCGPSDSSLWAKELNLPVQSHSLTLDIEQCLTAKKIYLAGGEPLIIDQFIELITRISKLNQQPELVINTNLTSVSDDLKLSLSKISKLTMVVSIDAFEKINEYHRWPLKWEKLIGNIKWLQENIKCNIQFNSVVDAVSVINLADLINIEHLADHWNLYIITSPKELLINNLPEIHKATVLTHFETIKKSKFYTTDMTFKTRVDNIISVIPAAGDPVQLSKYISQLDHRRGINHEDYLKIKLT